MEIYNLTLAYGQNLLVHSASFSLLPGHLTALLGRNGSGKSTLLRALAGICPPADGEITCGGRPIYGMSVKERARSVAVVNTERRLAGGLTCRQVVALGRSPYTGWTGRLSDADSAAVVEALEAVEMDNWGDREIETLSDGEYQRVMVARAIAQDTPVILLDEPTAFLDYPNRRNMAVLLGRLSHEKGKAVLYSTHEIELALEYCDDILLMDPPRIYSGAKDEKLISERLKSAFF